MKSTQVIIKIEIQTIFRGVCISEFDKIAAYLRIQVFLGSDFLLCVGNALTATVLWTVTSSHLKLITQKLEGGVIYIFCN